MKVYYNLQEFQPLDNAIVTIGTFDGVHVGHQKILQRLSELALSTNGESVVMTFWPHPRMVVSQDSQNLKLLTTIDEKIQLFEKQGIDHLLIVPFTREFSELSAEEYVQSILIKRIGTKSLVIGYDHRFGKNREGGFEYLSENKKRFGISIEEITRQEIENLTISSTKIRNSLNEGKIKVANDLLGRHYSFFGVVVKGRQLGRTIGFPTANVYVSETYKLVPINGVYAVRIFVRGNWYEGIMNIGNRPTVEGIGITKEVNIFNFDDDIYGEDVTVEIIDFIRPETKFNGLEELKKQILHDVEVCKKMLMTAL